MPDHYEAVVTLPSTSGLVADEVQNTFSFSVSGGPGPTSKTNLINAIIDFYNATPAGSSAPVGAFLSPELSRVANAASVKLYLRPATPGPSGSPNFGPLSFTLTATAGVALPGQDALVLSMHADLSGVAESGPLDATIPSTESAIDQGAPATHSGLDRMASRRRGRIFLGPLVQATGAAGPHSEWRPSSTYRAVVKNAASALALATSDISWDWEVFSRRDWAGYNIVGGWVDNRYDTQRRRLESATSRDTWSA